MTVARKMLRPDGNTGTNAGNPHTDAIGRSAELETVAVPAHLPKLTPLQQKTLGNIMSGAEYARALTVIC
jgi:hypothetical protein